jgi:ABC-type transport system involved in Fe-S cluster assembly fused permease/ATPase subunit
MRYLIMIRYLLPLAVVVCLTTFTTVCGQSLTHNANDPCETLKRREKQLLDSLIKFEALKPAFENAKEIIDTYDKQLQEVRELQAQQAAIQDEQHRKELRQEKRKQRLKGIRDGFLGAITTAGIFLILL